MNRVIIWNDFAPINARDIIEYAHARNIKVIWGFSWLWDTRCNRVDIRNIDDCSAEIFAKYEAEYAGICPDGFYFQTFTEIKEDSLDGVLIAEAATKFVNETAALFYEKYPDIDIQFGLHATSVNSRLEFIKKTDSRIRIVWEDCGAFPFSYIPNDVKDFEQTKGLVESIANLRGEDDRFGIVTKGLVKLDWLKFEHPKGPQCIGFSSDYMKKNRTDRKWRIWRYIQALWLANADYAQAMIAHTCRIKGRDFSAFALVEDGMFEENIAYPVALYSEMLWDADTDVKSLLSDVALRSYVTFF